MRRTSLLILLTSIALLLASPIAAQIVLDGDAIPLGDLGSSNRDASMLPSGDFVVVWQDYGHVYGQKVIGGTPGQEFQVSSYSYSLNNIKVDADGSGDFWVVWNDSSAANARGFDSSTEPPTPLGSEFALGGYSSSNIRGMGARRTAGGFVVLYSAYSYLYATGVNGSGSPTFTVPAANSFSGKIAVDPTGNFLVVWPGDGQLYAAGFDPSGTGLGTPPIEIGDGASTFDVAALSTGNFVVAWSEYSPYDIKAQLVTTTATSGPVIDVASGFFSYPGVAVAGNDANFVVVWHENYGFAQTSQRNDDGAPTHRTRKPAPPENDVRIAGTLAAGDVTAMAFNSDGTPVAGGPVVMNSGFSVTNSTPTVSMNNAGQFVVVWNSYSYYAASERTSPHQFGGTYAQLASFGVACPTATAPSRIAPLNGATLSSPVTFQWSAVAGATGYDLFVGVGSSPTLHGSTSGTSLSVNLGSGSATWYVVANFGVGCPTAQSSSGTFTVQTTCPTPSTPTLVAPDDGAEFEIGEFVKYEWTAAPGATRYEVWAKVNGGAPQFLGATANLFLNRAIQEGTTEWYVIVFFGATCDSATTVMRTVFANAAPPPPPPPPPPCGLDARPLPSIVAEATTGENYVLRWDALPDVAKYRVQESSTASFFGIISERIVEGLETEFTHPGLTQPTAFFYRVAGIPPCDETKLGPYSLIIRVVGLPKPQPSSINPQVVSEFGNEEIVETFLFIPGFGESSKTTSVATFSASSNEPWLTVHPSSGTLPPAGITVSLLADPTEIDLGANTATITVVRDDGLGKTTTGSSTSSIPVAVSLVTPVSPVPKSAGPPANALIVPAVANVSGANSKWFSDVKITNRSGQLINYQLNFSATDQSGIVEGKQTKIRIRPGQTVALDDVVRQWYGFGDLADGTNGALEIRPINFTGKVGSQAAPMLATVASSRTYTRSENSLASFGQFIPAIPFSSFLKAGVADSLLMMQQVSQTESLRTNFGLVEGAGKEVNVLLTAYDRQGTKLGEFPVALKAGEHKQLNSLLALSGISVEDGRMTVQIVSGDGAVTSYASVVASGTGDPSLVPGVNPFGTSASKYVLPGVADLRVGAANWRSDVRIFNPNDGVETVNVFFYPQGETTPLGPVEIQLQPGQIEVLPGVVENLFGQQDLGGALHIVPISGQATSLVITGETYDVSELGKYGQFIPAVTEANAIGVGSLGLEVMQVEASAQFRTNLGLSEVTGQAATVQIQLTVPNSLIAPTRLITLDGNEFQQLNGIVGEMTGGRDVYNGRLTVRVIGGTGKITAYGSTVDNQTQDATYTAGQ